MTVGWFKKGMFLQKLDVGGYSTKTSGLNVFGTISSTGSVAPKSVTASSQVKGTKGIVETAQKLSHSTGQAALNAFGLSVLSATAASTYTLGPPPTVGTMKYITMSTATVNFVVKTTAALVGTTRTKFSVIASKAPLASQNGRYGATLVGATGGKWALVSYSPTSTAFTIT